MARKKPEQGFSTPVPAYMRCQYEGCIYPARLEVRGKWVCTDHYGQALRQQENELNGGEK